VNHASYGVHILSSTSATGIAVNSNKIVTNALFGAINQGTGTLDATCNWWGTADGDDIPAEISGSVNYTPWLGNGTDNEPGTPGFQPVPNSCNGTPVVIASAVPDPIICGETTGSINVSWTGGVANYTVDWGTGSQPGVAGSPYNITGLAAGSYTITITDDYGTTSAPYGPITVLYLPVTNVTDDPDTYYATIQAAINAASNGEEIHVCAGTYPEQLIVDKGLTIIGDVADPDNVIIDGENKTDFTVAGQVRIYNPTGEVDFKGFKIINSGRTSSSEHHGFITKSAYKVTVQDCRIIGHGSSVPLGEDYGLWATGSTGELVVKNNYFTDLYHGILLERQFGQSTIQSNTFDDFVIGYYAPLGGNVGGRAIEAINYATADITTLQRVTENQFINFRSTGVLFSGGFSGQIPKKFTDVEIDNNDFEFLTTDIVNSFGAVNLRNVSNSGSNDDPNGGVTANVHNNYIDVPSVSSIIISGLNGTILANDNYIADNGFYGVDANASLGPQINATCNWWETANGNLIPTMISGDVIYSPWLLDGTNEATGPGFYQSSPNCNGTPVDITSAVPDHIICGETTGSINVSWTGGVANYTVDWGTGSQPGVTGSPYNITELTAGSYTITVTDTYGTSDTYGPVEILYLPVTNVTDGLYFATIQAAIDAATTGAGEVIEVCEGIYNEAVTITKSLTINGAKAGIDARTRTFTGESILDGEPLNHTTQHDAFTFAGGVNNVVIDGFEIRNYYYQTNPSSINGWGNAIFSYIENAGVPGASNVVIQNNYIHDVGYNGILVGSENVTGESMTIQSNWLIQRNKLEDCPYAGIELTNVTSSQVKDNDITAPTLLFNDPGDAGVGIEIAARSRAKPVTAGTIEVSGNEITGVFPSGSRAGINLLSRAYQSVSNSILDELTVYNNMVSSVGNVRSGILLVSEVRNAGPAIISDVDLQYNVLDGNSNGIVIQDYLNGGSGTPSHAGIDISGNEIVNHASYGVHILSSTSATGITVNSNKIVSNLLFGAINQGTGTLDATDNWWGDPTGPYHPVKNICGLGNDVSDHVDFYPWWVDAGMTTPFVVPTPAITCPGNQTRCADETAGDTYTTAGTEFDPDVVDDPCFPTTKVNNLNGGNTLDGYIFDPGTTSVSWTITDAMGNDYYCNFDVTIYMLPDPDITGSASVCANSSVSYSTPNVPGNSYLWVVTGGIITGGQGTNQINVTWGSTDPGLVTVTEYSQTPPLFCSYEADKPVTILPLPTPVVYGPASADLSSIQTYWTDVHPSHAYAWNVTGGTILTGQNTTSITILWPGVPGSGTVTVSEANLVTSCSGTSAPLNVTVYDDPDNFSLTNVLILPSQTECYDAIETIYVAGIGTYFTMMPGSSVTMIAGQSIFYYPGTTINAGSYLHGYIAPNGPWCNGGTYVYETVSGRETDDMESQSTAVRMYKGVSFKVYPNPTLASFTLELQGVDTGEPVHVMIYSTHGGEIINDVLRGETKYDLSLYGQPTGLYFMRIVTKGIAETVKIVKL
jgi:pectin methylesterase-like acyl-CoA thioesterase